MLQVVSHNRSVMAPYSFYSNQQNNPSHEVKSEQNCGDAPLSGTVPSLALLYI